MLTVSHRESSNDISWAPGTSWRINFQSELKLYVTLGDAGGVYGGPADQSGLPETRTVNASSGRRVFDFMRASSGDGARTINGAVKAQSPPRPQRIQCFRG
jgi:hypothetical protein